MVIRWLLGEKMRGQPAELYDAIYHVPNGGSEAQDGGLMKRQALRLRPICR